MGLKYARSTQNSKCSMIYVCIFLIAQSGSLKAQWETVFGPLSITPIERIGDMSFVNDSVGYVVGYTEFQGANANYIMKTEDYANSWDTIFTYIHEPYPYAEFQDVFFIDENNGWVCGTNLGQIFKTDDGGENWIGYPLPDEIELLYTIKFADANYGIAQSHDVGNTGVETFDGGIIWSTAPAINGYDVSFMDACNFVVVRGGGIRHFNDCESTEQPFPTIDEFGDRNGRAVYMQDHDHWVLGSMGLVGFNNFASVLTTSDGGQTFVITDLWFANNQVECISFINQSEGFASVRNVNTYPCAILKTLNGGTTWHCQETPMGEYLGTGYYHYFNDIECPSSNYQYGSNGLTIFRTTNGGGPLGDTYTGVKVLANTTKTLNIFPNPTSSIIHIEISDGREVKAIEIYNSVGQRVETSGASVSGLNSHSTQPEIEVGHLAPGCYTVVVRYENEIIRSRFVVE